MGLYFGTGAVGLNPPEVISNEVLSRHNVYGVVFDGTGNQGKPLYNAIDQKWIPATPTSPGVDTWKNLAPFNVKKCITDYDASEASKRKVLAYEGDSNYNTLKAAKTGDRMVEFPLGYYYRPDKWTFIVSPDPIEGFQPSPGHDLGSGNILTAFRRSEFDVSYVSSTPRSIPGAAPWATVTIGDSMTALKNRGLYHQTFGVWCWINFLRLIKQQNLNSQKVNGNGMHTGNATKTMVEDNIQGLDGYVSLNGNNDVRTLGIQNFYGHVWNFLHNVLVRNGTKVWVKKDFTAITSFPTYANAAADGWEELDIAIPDNSGNGRPITELAWNSANPYALYPSKVNGSVNWTDITVDYPEPIGDCMWSRVNDPWSEVLVGGNAWNGLKDGSLAWNSAFPLSYANAYYGLVAVETA